VAGGATQRGRRRSPSAMAWRSSWTGRWSGPPGSGSPRVAAEWCCGGLTGVRGALGRRQRGNRAAELRSRGGEGPLLRRARQGRWDFGLWRRWCGWGARGRLGPQFVGRRPTWACAPGFGTSPRFAAGDFGRALRKRGGRIRQRGPGCQRLASTRGRRRLGPMGQGERAAEASGVSCCCAKQAGVERPGRVRGSEGGKLG